jgi:tetratricopeptide (TPR) repeat protein
MMTRFVLSAVLAGLSVAAAAQPPYGGARTRSDLAQAARQTPSDRSAPLPQGELTQAVMFKMMLAEIALQRGQAQVAVQAYLELAHETRDPRVAQRATEIAWNARLLPAALEAAGVWLRADPESQRARQVIAALLVNQAKLSEALPHLENWLAADPANVGATFLQIAALVARHQDRKAAWQLLQVLARPYPELPEARLAIAQAAW